LLEPLVTWIEHHSRLGQKNRTWAIAQVYLIGMLALGGLGYEYGPRLVAQIESLNAALPEILEGLSNGKAPVGLDVGHGMSAYQQLRLQQLVVRHHDFIVHAFERGASSATYVAESPIWLFAIPILAIFILRDGRQMVKAFSEAAEPCRDRTLVKGILQRVDTMPAKLECGRPTSSQEMQLKRAPALCSGKIRVLIACRTGPSRLALERWYG
jgi:predicted PurR-regulated permease PerM